MARSPGKFVWAGVFGVFGEPGKPRASAHNKPKPPGSPIWHDRVLGEPPLAFGHSTAGTSNRRAREIDCLLGSNNCCAESVTRPEFHGSRLGLIGRMSRLVPRNHVG